MATPTDPTPADPTGQNDATQSRLPRPHPVRTPPSPSSTETPSRIGRFEILRLLGEGAFGRVYEANDPSLKRAVALKVAKPEQLQGERRLERFKGEARAAARLAHPNIVTLFDHGEESGLHYIASAYIVGRTLSEELKSRSGPTPLREAALVARRLAEALAYAHKSRVIHRDVKPANVMLNADGEPMLMDFGLAARLDEAEKLTQDGQVMGTPEYLAPEQWRGKAEPASDQYSLGCVLYEMLAGQAPFGGGNFEHYAVLHLTQAPVSPRALRKEVPKDLETICLKCLEKEAGKRYADCQALADDLRRWMEGEPIQARRPGPMERVVKWARRNPALAGMLATVLACALVAVYFGVSARQQAKEAKAALERVEETLAVGLLRPLGNQEEVGLTDFEIITLEELASIPRENDRARVLFIDKALEKPGTAEQLERCAEEALVAAVGLRRDLRERVLEVAGRRLREASSSAEVRVASACVLASVRSEDQELARHGKDAILTKVAKSTDYGVLVRLAEASKRHSEFLSSKDAAEVARRVVSLAAKATDANQLRALVQAFAALAPRLADKDAAEVARQVVSLAAKTTAEDQLRELGQAYAALAPRLPADQAAKHSAEVARQVVSLAAKTTSPLQLRLLVLAYAALAPGLPADQAAKHSAEVARRVVSLAAEDTDADQLRALVQAFAALAPRLPADQAAKHSAEVARRVVSLAAKTTDAYHQSMLGEAYAALAPRLPADQAARGAVAFSSRLGRMISGTSLSVDETKTLAVLLPLLPDQPLLDVLKQPGLGPDGRAAVVAEFGKRLQRKFRHQWDLAEHLERARPDLDLASPLTPR